MGGGSNDAQRDAERAEAQRQAAIRQTQRQIDYVFGSPERQKQIQDFLAATRTYYRDDANKQQDEAARQLRFAMARSGLTGGQFDADKNRQLGETYRRGLLEADRRAQGAAANLSAQDQQAKQNLFALAQSGLDSTTAINQAAQNMRQNVAIADLDARERSLGDMFGQFGSIYQNSLKQAEDQKAQRYVYNTLYQPSTYGKGGGG